jgi:hypothetical protein
MAELVCVCSVCGREQRFRHPTDNQAPRWMTPADRAYGQAVSYGWTWGRGEEFCGLHEKVTVESFDV